MTVSVCMGVYNGARYITEQLYSILHQTRQPDEVIICDDVSTDDTVEIVQAFIRDNGLEATWKLYCNQENKGYPSNFFYACGLCTKEIVFLADQDDIWHEEKIARMCEVFAENPEANAVCCKFGLIDAEGKDIQTIMAPTHSKESKQLREVSVKDIFYRNEYPGMVVAYRNAWAEEWLPADSKIPHDFLICVRAAEENAFRQLDMELAYHRRHDNNAGGEEHRINRLLNRERKLKEIEKYLEMLETFRTENLLKTDNGKKALGSKLESMQARLDALKSGSVGKVIKNARRHREEVRLSTVICDVMIAKR